MIFLLVNFELILVYESVRWEEEEEEEGRVFDEGKKMAEFFVLLGWNSVKILEKILTVWPL